jgi:uncharacterized protein
MLATDSVALSGARLTRDGYLIADARVARAGVYQYAGHEVGRPELPVVNVYRSEDVVFSKAAMASFASRPMTLQHPVEDVNASNWKKYSVGYTGEEVARDGEFVRLPLIVTDADAVSAIQAGTRELSCGYQCAIEFKDGTAPDGTPFQAIMKDIKGNHLAIVDRGRAGNACRIGDSWKEFNDAGEQGKPGGESAREPAIIGDKDMTLRKIQFDGLTIETTDAGAEAIAKLNGKIADMAKTLADANAALDAMKADKAALVADHAKALAEAKAAIPTADALESMLDKRSAMIDTAKKIAPQLADSFKGKSGPDVRKAVVASKLGDAAVKDRSDDYVTAQFDALALQHSSAGSADPMRDAFKGGLVNTANDAAKARDEALEKQRNAWAA